MAGGAGGGREVAGRWPGGGREWPGVARRWPGGGREVAGRWPGGGRGKWPGGGREVVGMREVAGEVAGRRLETSHGNVENLLWKRGVRTV